MNIILANSTGINKSGAYIIHSPSRWSCTVRSKDNWFAYYPWELSYLSSLLKQEFGSTHSIKLLDGCLEQLDSAKYIERISSASPDWLIIESSTLTYDLNKEVAMAVKNRTGCKVVFTGQHSTAFPQKAIEDGADFVTIGEYEYTVLELLKGFPPEDIPGLYPNQRRQLINIKDLPWPEDDDISRLDYAVPGEPSSEFKEIQAYATRGCMRNCNFCVCRHVYYGKQNHRVRDEQDVADELKHLKNKYPSLEGIFFDEESHTQSKDFTLRLCDSIVKNKLDSLNFEAMCDISFIDNEILSSMQKAGYYKVRFGIESFNKKVTSTMHKTMEHNRLIERLEDIKRHGMQTYATFMIGAQDSTKETDIRTTEQIESLIKADLLDNVQISICTPQPGTPLFDWAKQNRLLQSYEWDKYDGGNIPVISYSDYTSEEILDAFKSTFNRRDHAILINRIKHQRIFPWIFRTLKKYGIKKTLLKACKRTYNHIRCSIQKLTRD